MNTHIRIEHRSTSRSNQSRKSVSRALYRMSGSDVRRVLSSELVYIKEISNPSHCLTTGLAFIPPQPYSITQDTMVQLKLKLATTAEDSIKSIKELLQQFSSDQITPSSHNTETDEIIFDFDVANDEAYQALGDQCQAWVDESNSDVAVYTMVRGRQMPTRLLSRKLSPRPRMHH